MKEQRETSWMTPEFFLVIVMLVVLTFLVVAVLWAPVEISGGTTAREILDYRKDILAIIITAFGAWVGAGAAYYFGRENMREAATSMLAMREISPEERLRRTPLREIPPRTIDWVVKSSDELKSVVDKLKEEPERWFIPVVKDDGTLDTVILEEGIWRFVMDSEILDKESSVKTVYDNIIKTELSEVVKYIRKMKGLERFEGERCYVAVTPDKSAGYVHDLMQNKNVYLAVVTDSMGKPTHFINVSDLKKVLLKIG